MLHSRYMVPWLRSLTHEATNDQEEECHQPSSKQRDEERIPHLEEEAHVPDKQGKWVLLT